MIFIVIVACSVLLSVLQMELPEVVLRMRAHSVVIKKEEDTAEALPPVVNRSRVLMQKAKTSVPRVKQGIE